MAKIGIVGTGWGARVQVPAFREAGLEVVALAGFQHEKTRKLAEELGGLRAYADWRELVASDVDLVSIVTPPSEHREMATAALAAGKHVLSEKPTALDAREAEQLVAAAREHAQQIAIIDHELRFLPAWRVAREAMQELGAIRYAEVRYASPGRGDRSRAWNWWSDAERGGGIWGAVGSHFVDALRYLGLEIDAVQATLHTAIAERPFENGTRAVTSDDVAFVNLRLRGGAVATMSFSVVASGPDEPATLTIHGEDAAMRFISEEVLFAKRGEPFTRRFGDDLAPRPGNSPGGAFGSGTLHLGHALRTALDNGDRTALAPAATFEDGLAQQRVLDAARRSNANDGRWERVS
ncbi:MAG TPA: Gfo/Idh/MocA family oxidoreductase [Thermoanaerobaculia bacterium]|nr:Gfo/Idh/MocA family oxidoreductase [Thermoanaerobaculia bacterium]